MKLTEIHIDSHGAWRDVALPLKARGLSVIYGPNEAGKSTLRQFIGGVLFGFAKRGGSISDGPGEAQPIAGSLQFEDDAGIHRLHRAAAGGQSGDVYLIADNAARPAGSFLENLLKGVDENLFETVFAADWRELIRRCSIPGDDVFARLFEPSTDPTGERILEAVRRVDEKRAQLIDPLQKEGMLVDAFERHDQLIASLGEVEKSRDRHAELCLRRDRLESEIADLRKRQTGTAEQLRGHEFLERVWGPWSRIRECEGELEELPDLHDFPRQGLVRLEKLESAIAESAERRDRLVAEARNIREQLRGPAGENAWHIHAPALRALVEQRACLVELRERRAAADRTALDCERKFAVAREELGPGWTTERIEAGDISYAARRRFSGTAESLLAARVRRRALRRKCRRLAGACRDLKESLAESLHDLGGLSVDAAVAQAREQLDAFNRIAELRLRGVELSGRIDSLKRQRERVTLQLNLPRWVYLVLGIFGFMGVMLAGWGLVAGLATNGIAGAIYAMLGITTWGLAWGLKLQYEGDARERLGEIDAAAADAVEEERRLRDSMHELAGSEADSADSAGLICRASTRIGELVDLAASQRRLRGMRKSLAAARKRLATARREVATAAQNWRELLSKIGFTEVLSVDEALAAWEKLAEASERLAAWNAARRDAESAAAIGEIYLKRIEELAGALPDGPADLREPAEIVSIWQEQLALLDRRQAERRVQCAMLRDRKRQARRHNRRARWLKIRRDALLVQGGAASRDEFEERARSFVRRVELSDQLRDSRRDLDAICDDHADLAIVEEDLLRVDPRQNEECIEMLRRELEDLRRDLDRYSESLADVRHEVDLLENDRQATRVRFDVRQTEEQMRVLAGQWAAYESAFQVLAQIRRDYERSHQPRSLALTADFLSRITNGRYRRVWSPLGERRLIVDDEPGRSFPMHSLSRSTREQLALAVRLALVRKLAAQGIDLPLILDDVLVNFDEQRARSTIDLLLELAGQGQQVLFFTCHNHLAQLFASRGIEPIWLPGRPAPSEVHEEKRLAG